MAVLHQPRSNIPDDCYLFDAPPKEYLWVFTGYSDGRLPYSHTSDVIAHKLPVVALAQARTSVIQRGFAIEVPEELRGKNIWALEPKTQILRENGTFYSAQQYFKNAIEIQSHAIKLMLRDFIRECVSDVVYLWPAAPRSVRRFLATGEGSYEAFGAAYEYHRGADILHEIEANVATAVQLAVKTPTLVSDLLWVIALGEAHGVKANRDEQLEAKLVNLLASSQQLV